MAGFCGNCGMRLTGNTKYCPDCGSVIADKAQAQEAPELVLSEEPNIVDNIFPVVKADPTSILRGNASYAFLAAAAITFLVILFTNMFLALGLLPILFVAIFIVLKRLERKEIEKELEEEDMMVDQGEKPLNRYVKGHIKEKRKMIRFI